MFSKFFAGSQKSVMKRLCLVATALPLILSGISCTPKIGEQPPDPKNFELTATKCLNKSANDLKDFFDANVDDARLAAAWSCLSTAFLQFEKYVVGKNQDRYTSQEIVDFLETNFFENAQENKLTPALQVEVMKLKQIFIGGDTNFVTREELRKSQSFFQQISKMTVKLNPHMKIIVMKWKPNLDTIRSEDLAAFESANTAMQEFAVELAAVIGNNHSLYHISDIVTLFKEFEKFFHARWDWVTDIEKLVPGAKKLKLALAGGDENTINEREWNPVLTLGVRGYFQYLRYRYFIQTTHETGGAIRLVYVANTLEDVFSIFQELVAQKPSGVVTSHEVYEILHGFQEFWNELKVSEKLVSEFMKVKKVLIGGNTETWTAVDFEQARLKVPELRRIIENFMPYFSIYASEWDPEMEEPAKAREIFEQSRVRLASVGQDFGRFLVGPYSYDDFVELVNEINALYPNVASKGFFKNEMVMMKKTRKTKKRTPKPNPAQQNPVASNGSNPGALTVDSQVGPSADSNPDPANRTRGSKNFAEKIAQYRDVFLSAKKMIYGQNDTTIGKDQWPEVLPLVAQIYSLYQYYDYFLADKSWKHTQAVQDMGQFVNNTVGFGHDLLSTSTKGYFSQAELDELTLKLSKTDLFNEDLKAETTDNAWKALLQHILFPPERRLKGEKNDRLTGEQFDILKAEFAIWRKTQVILNEIFSNDPEKGFSSADMMRLLKDRLQRESDPELKTGLEGIIGVLNSPATATWNSEDELEISNRVEWQYKMNALFQTNLTRALTRLLMRSFSTDPNLSRVNKCETQAAFDLLAGIFRDLKIFDPAKGFVNSRFLEANIFMPRGNGDKFLDYDELSDLINIIFSGLRVNSKLESSLRNICAVNKTPEGKEFVTFKCMSEHHYVMVRKYMTQLPDFKAYIEKLASKDKGESSVMRDPDDLTAEENPNDPEDPNQPAPTDPQSPAEPRKGPRPGFSTWNSVFRQMLKATGWNPNKGYGNVKEESVLLDESLYYPFIVHYTEMLYSKFDYTKNGYLQSFEAKKAFPTFQPLLKDVAADQIRKGLIKESDLLSLFTFILRYKTEPGLSTILKWLAWKDNNSKWEREVWVGRTDMGDILGFIADKTRDSGSSGGNDSAPVCK